MTGTTGTAGAPGTTGTATPRGDAGTGEGSVDPSTPADRTTRTDPSTPDHGPTSGDGRH
ncbi:hypothetical protein MTQ22_03445 [Corynebacterium bovis]